MWVHHIDPGAPVGPPMNPNALCPAGRVGDVAAYWPDGRAAQEPVRTGRVPGPDRRHARRRSIPRSIVMRSRCAASTGSTTSSSPLWARHISDALAEFLPADRSRALRLILDSLDTEHDADDLNGMEGFRYLPFVFFVADHGLITSSTAMAAQYELTKRFTAEFSIRAYLEHHPEATLDRLHESARDPNVHVRRLVSEGTRPRLPWAPRLRAFQEDPGPVVDLLELLRDDPEEYVRRSVANNLNDIAKDHPDLTVEIARRWWSDGDEQRLKAGPPRPAHPHQARRPGRS